jgi:hypothetical protein
MNLDSSGVSPHDPLFTATLIISKHFAALSADLSGCTPLPGGLIREILTLELCGLVTALKLPAFVSSTKGRRSEVNTRNRSPGASHRMPRSIRLKALRETVTMIGRYQKTDPRDIYLTHNEEQIALRAVWNRWDSGGAIDWTGFCEEVFPLLCRTDSHEWPLTPEEEPRTRSEQERYEHGCSLLEEDSDQDPLQDYNAVTKRVRVTRTRNPPPCPVIRNPGRSDSAVEKVLVGRMQLEQCCETALCAWSTLESFPYRGMTQFISVPVLSNNDFARCWNASQRFIHLMSRRHHVHLGNFVPVNADLIPAVMPTSFLEVWCRAGWDLETSHHFPDSSLVFLRRTGTSKDSSLKKESRSKPWLKSAVEKRVWEDLYISNDYLKWLQDFVGNLALN